MKYLLIVLFGVLLMGCKEDLPPTYKIGDKVQVENTIKGTVVEIRGWIGAGNPTHDYNVMIENSSAVIWYDEEQLRLVK